MTKFAMINTNSNSDEAKVKAFNKKFTASNLKKRLKCSQVIELKISNIDENTLQSLTSIDVNTFSNFVNELSNFDISTMTKNSWYKRNSQKYFAFSEDVKSTSTAFNKLREEATFTLFEIDEDEADAFIENVEKIKYNSDLIDDLNQAKEALETLQNYEHQLDLSLTTYEAENDIDTMTSNLEDEVQEANEQLNDYLEWFEEELK